MASPHSKMCILIGHTICESLVKMQQFRHEWSSIIMYENTQKKRNKIKRHSIPYSYIGHFDISTYVYYLDIQLVKVWWIYYISDMNSRQKRTKILLKNT